MNLPKRYDSKTSERKWQRYWEDEGIYAFDPTSNKPVYAIDTPPPTVSGKMHLGHAFSFSQMDFVARYKRMKGHNLFYPFGTDDNGLATERLVERKNNVNSKKMDRQEFIDLCLETLEKIRPDFVQDWKDIGMSCDFSVFYSTINEHSRRISQRSFMDLYEKDRINKEFAPIIFCPKCQTAIAQVEMEDKEKKSELHYIKAAVDKDTYVLFATTRPELIYGCVGMSIDTGGTYVKIKRGDEFWITSKASLEYLKEHFKFTVEEELQGVDLMGRSVKLPMSNHTVSISSDDAVEAEYGTGIVYFCTYGGTEDIEWLTRHDAEPRHVMGSDGRYTEGMIKGMKSKEARETILDELDESRDLILRKSISQTVNVHERCGTDIEYVATEQWFIQVLDLSFSTWQKRCIGIPSS